MPAVWPDGADNCEFHSSGMIIFRSRSNLIKLSKSTQPSNLKSTTLNKLLESASSFKIYFIQEYGAESYNYKATKFWWLYNYKKGKKCYLQTNLYPSKDIPSVKSKLSSSAWMNILSASTVCRNRNLFRIYIKKIIWSDYHIYRRC